MMGTKRNFLGLAKSLFKKQSNQTKHLLRKVYRQQFIDCFISGKHAPGQFQVRVHGIFFGLHRVSSREWSKPYPVNQKLRFPHFFPIRPTFAQPLRIQHHRGPYLLQFFHFQVGQVGPVKCLFLHPLEHCLAFFRPHLLIEYFPACLAWILTIFASSQMRLWQCSGF